MKPSLKKIGLLAGAGILIGSLSGCLTTNDGANEPANVASSGASAAGEPETVTSMNAMAGSWRLSALSILGTAVPIPDGADITFQVDEDGSFSGKAAVNRYFGDLELQPDGTLNFPEAMGVTKMMGAPDMMKIETQYLNSLSSITTASREGDSLVLSGGSIQMRFGPAGSA